ncbi:SAM-dependent methyltransferase [Neolewinella antarctica]|uniref:Sarcosine/dimethylglycine N-methyltransferase n=1 Tax=Neolewinella antarctica TaxID=442734 RepID=A0ABX0X876_9BACT|nr:methyltransferase domain-containing protein [Neolewinella antarctica]NJC25357.1 sarcosine/dimethylglycine N-methyltransferase [Neolewinella antarctica]
MWGGDDLHVGIYSDEVDNPTEAAQATTDRMLRLLPRIKKSTRMLVLQAGFGTAARYIATEHMCKVECLNDNEAQNTFNQEKINEAELHKMMHVTLGDVDYMPFNPDYFDFVFAQDSFSITAQKRQMFRAIHRVMKPEARLIFCAIMRAEKVSPAGEERIASLPVEELITAADYEDDARRGFFQKVYALDLSKNLAAHFAKLEESLDENRAEMVKQTSEKFVNERKRVCQIFRELAEEGDLRWGIMMFQKLNS